MRGETLAEAWPVYTPSKPGTRRTTDEDQRGFLQGWTAILGVVLLIFSLRRYLRRRAKWMAGEKAKTYDRPDDPPPSTDIAPIAVRIDGSPKTMVIVGDDDQQFRLRARGGLTLFLEDGRRATFHANTPLKCTFPGFTLVTKDNRGSVGVAGGTEFFVVAELPEGAPPPVRDGAHPFRQAAMDPPIELVPVQDRYECRLDPAPVRRRRLARLLPKVKPRDPAKKPRWRPYLHPGILIGILFVFARWGRPWEIPMVLLWFATLFGLGGEDAGWVLDEKDL